MNDKALPDAHQSHRNKAKYLKRRRGYPQRISHLTKQARTRLFFRLQLWRWKMQREKSCFWFRAKKRKRLGCLISSGPNLVTRSSQNVDLLGEHHPLIRQSTPKPANLSEMHAGTKSVQNQVAAVTNKLNVPCQSHRKEVQAASSDLCHTAKPQLDQSAGHVVCAGSSPKVQRNMRPSQSRGVDGPLGQYTTHIPHQNQSNRDTGERIAKKKVSSQSQRQTDVGHKTLTKGIHEFLDDFYRKYGSFIPLQQSDLLKHLKRTFNVDFSDRKYGIFSEVTRYQSTVLQRPIPSFRVVCKKHTLTLEDLSTLANENWLNDQVINMYGELIMESTHHQVHFLSSFFHRQLVTKGYEGVKRWTKQVNLFSKCLILVPIHLEVHWCLVTADIAKKRICLYDSQGSGLQKVARNILKYLMIEAKERQQTAFESGWTVSVDEKVPQQTNENDCGVFVLEYSRCLAHGKPLCFSQNDIPKIRKRIYKELCDVKLHD
ncbi:sentrin-specific protease 5-like [Genypterus blacodes]|uniref:sentrin-specific protease 5-like n=1 Tax=Genypterus blacodes TaxID=154954 RepID=UPI003F76B580